MPATMASTKNIVTFRMLCPQLELLLGRISTFKGLVGRKAPLACRPGFGAGPRVLIMGGVETPVEELYDVISDGCILAEGDPWAELIPYMGIVRLDDQPENCYILTNFGGEFSFRTTSCTGTVLVAEPIPDTNGYLVTISREDDRPADETNYARLAAEIVSPEPRLAAEIVYPI